MEIFITYETVFAKSFMATVSCTTEMQYLKAVGFGHNSLASLRSLIYKVTFACP